MTPGAPGRRRDVLVRVLVLVWACTVIGGLASLWAFAKTPGIVSGSTAEWPAAAPMARDTALPTLLMFVHPQCPCSRASVEELAILLTGLQGRARTYVMFYRPSDAPPDWERTGTWASAARIPGVTVLADPDGREADRFEMRVSGETVLFDLDGTRIFSGGITPARGHDGDSVGRDTLEALLGGRRGLQRTTRVFGCVLTGAPVRSSP